MEVIVVFFKPSGTKTEGMDWVEKYRPASLSDITGNGTAIRQVIAWARDWHAGVSPLLLYGKPGTGKTSTAHALAHDMGWEPIEFNASDQRTGPVLEHIAGASATTTSLTGNDDGEWAPRRKLIIFDEADNLHGSADRGGAKAIIGIIKEAKQPVMLIANDIYGMDKEIKTQCDMVQFRALTARSVAPRLRYICSKEGVTCSDGAVQVIAESAGGDLRAAVNMLYAAAAGMDHLDEDMVSSSQKDERSTIFDLISALFQRTRDQDLLRKSYELSDTPDTIVQWVQANIDHLDDLPSIAAADAYLAESDLFIGRTLRRQYYTMWRYATAIMLIGTASVADGRGLHARINSPGRWRRMATAKQQKGTRNSVFKKVGESYHIPGGALREGLMTPVSYLIEADPAWYASDLRLDTGELNYFIHDKVVATEVVKELVRQEREAGKIKKQKIKAVKGKNPEPAPVLSSEDVSAPAVISDSNPAPVPDEKLKDKKAGGKQATLFGGF